MMHDERPELSVLIRKFSQSRQGVPVIHENPRHRLA